MCPDRNERNEPLPIASLFGERAARLLTAPEQLDRLFGVVTPKDWLAFVLAGFLVAGAGAWSILAKIDVTVAAQAVLVPENLQSVEITAPQTGWLVRIAGLDQTISSGEVIAAIDPVEMRTERAQLRLQADRLLDDQNAARLSLSDRIADEQSRAVQRAARLDETIGTLRRETAEVGAAVARRQALLKLGWTTAQNLEDVRRDLYTLQDSLGRATDERAGLDIAAVATRTEAQSELQNLAASERVIDARIAELDKQIALTSAVASPIGGSVLGHWATAGQRVEAGARLVTVQHGGNTLQAIAYVPAEFGKSIVAGMAARLSPSTLPPETYGVIWGTVSWVSSAPRSQAEAAALLAEPDLARDPLTSGLPIEVHIRLNRDLAHNNAYDWSASAGRSAVLSRGTIAHVLVTIRRERPIFYAIPSLRRLFRSDAS